MGRGGGKAKSERKEGVQVGRGEETKDGIADH